MDHRAFPAGVGSIQKRQDTFLERVLRAEMVVSDWLHENTGCAEQRLVLVLKIDRKTGQLSGVEQTTHSGDMLGPHEVRPFKDPFRRRVRHPRPVRCRLASSGRPEM